MIWRSKWYGTLGLSFGTFLGVVPAFGWAEAPKKKAPAEAKLREAEALKEDYERLYGEGKYGESAALAERACAILGEEHGSESVEVAGCFSDLGIFLRVQGSYEKAESLHGRALAIREKALGPHHLDVATSLNNLALLHHVQGAYGNAESLFERALSIREKALGPDHPDVATNLNNLALLHHAKGAYEEAKPLFERALIIREKALGPDRSDVAISLSNLALLHHAQGAYEEAKPLFERSLAIWEKELGPDHPDVATSLNNLGSLYHVQGAYGKAEPLLKRALAIWEKELGPDHPDIATALSNLGSLYHAQGAYEKAEPLYERALIINEKALGPDHSDVASSLNNLASLYHDQGAYGRAEQLHERALIINEKALGPDHPNVASSLTNLALLYYIQGAYGKAEPLYERALGILEKAVGPHHPGVASSLNNLALLYHTQGSYEKAEPLAERALGIRENALGPNHPDVALSLNNLASLYHAQGMFGKAKPLVERALAIFENALGPDHPDVALSLTNLAILYHTQGNHDAALELHRRALDIEDTNLARTLTVSDESRRLAYTSTLLGSLHYAVSLHLRIAPQHDSIADLALTTLLRRKNRVQDLVTQSTAALRRSLPRDDRHLLDDLSDVDSQIAVLSSRGPGKLGVEAYAQQLYEIRRQRDQLWSELAKHSALVEALEHPITIEDVQRTLSQGSVLVELVQYVPRHNDAGVRVRPHETKPPPRYAAYIVFPDRFDWVDLGPAAPIDEHIKTFRHALQTKQPIPPDLYDAVMRPIVAKLDASTHHLIIAPAGALSLIPFGALHDGNHYLIEQYDLRYVTTGRDLLPPPAAPPVPTTPVTIIANPTGAGLPDAETEADFLATFFPETRILRADQATETNVRTVERPLIFHLATHGFFGEARNERDNPMFHSGLYLADIEQVEVDRELDDGQLTAYEVSGMDLRGTQLVVLSACETGMGAATKAEGKVLMSEGVSGLRRAFAIAGATTTVMSLWAVSGVTAQTTMEAYYRKLAGGQGPGEAMQAVQLEMLRTEEHAHPKDWAVFIVSGDDDPLEFPVGQEPRVVETPPLESPPPVRRRLGCTLGAPSADRELPLPGLFLGLLGLVALRRRRRREPD